jgi:hypothetical protein
MKIFAVFFVIVFALIEQSFAAKLCREELSTNRKSTVEAIKSQITIAKLQPLKNRITAYQDSREVPISNDDEVKKVISQVYSDPMRGALDASEQWRIPGEFKNYWTAYDLRKDSQILLFFKSPLSGAINENGFLNQHQTGTSNGNLASESRMQQEDQLLGEAIGQSPNELELRPKSALVNLTAEKYLGHRGLFRFYQGQFDTGDKMEQYGDSAAVFKDAVKERALMTTDDSLKVFEAGSPVSALAHFGQKEILVQNTIIPSDSPRPLETAQQMAQTKWSVADQYFEALIFGRLTADDVEYFLARTPEAVQQLKVFGKKVYQLKIDEEFQRKYFRTVYRKGTLLYDPAAKKKKPTLN